MPADPHTQGDEHLLQTPGAGGTLLRDDDLLAFCRQRIEKGSKSFAGAARLFDPQTRASAMMLYAWCRHCDDVVDGQELGFVNEGGGQTACSVRLAELHRKTAEALDGRFDEPVFQALSVVAQRHDIAGEHPLDLIEGFAMDVAGRRYETVDDTLSYCYHVAGVVGVMMAQIMGVRDHATLARASDLGIAFQLTNIARDVVPDAHAARVYLPLDLLERHGLSPRDIAREDARPEVAQAVAELLDLADTYYGSAGQGVSALPFRSAWAVASARRVYRDIGRLVRDRGRAAWDQRTSTGRRAKLAGTAIAMCEAAAARVGSRKADAASRAGLWTPPFLRVMDKGGLTTATDDEAPQVTELAKARGASRG